MDLEPYLSDISLEHPCGPDLQWDPDYVELARVMQGRPEVEYGGMRIDAAAPDWKTAKALALNLLSRSRDLRLMIWVLRALTAQHGFAGLADGLTLLEASIERYWEHLHPALDEDGDPTERLNTIFALDDPEGLLRQVWHAPLIHAPTSGPVCPRDIEIAMGEMAPRHEEKPLEAESIEAAVHAVECAQVEACVALLEQACASLARIEALLAQRVGAGYALTVDRLPKVLSHAAKALRDHASRHPGHATVSAPPPARFPGDERGAADAEPAMPAADADGDIRSRDDVAILLDRICEYYALQEPGSPVPALLQRAKRLIHMNFIELMSELAPQSSAEIGFLLGIRPEMPNPGIDPSEAYSTH